MNDPHATLPFEARPTHANALAKHRIPVVPVVLTAMVLVGIAGAVAFIVLYLGWTNKAAIAPNRSNNSSVSTTGAANNNPGYAMEQENQETPANSF
jgi:hypothetical protein